MYNAVTVGPTCRTSRIVGGQSRYVYSPLTVYIRGTQEWRVGGLEV